MKFVSGLVIGIALCGGAWTLSAQNERARHPRIAAAIEALRDARAYMSEASHDFGGHRVKAVRACDEAIRELQSALEFRESRDR